MTAPRTARQAHYRSADWITIHPVGTCDCRRCRPRSSPGSRAATSPQPTLAPETAPGQAPIELPTEPRQIRIHSPGMRPFDCTLHPDGTLTAVMHGKPYRNLCTFADMLERNWANSHIDWNPEPLPDEEPEHAPPVLPGAENADEAGVHGADEDSGESGGIVGEVSLSSARCRGAG
ncbi:hypothetical protein [Streptomyces cavernae]|uniref:hypothetical protein n=1 Tax=Streptomyces cavernae TaxID=2259034 RepID=UPI000FEBEFAE|nr:hypothetical protein [Streptomyces cavernae]